MAEKGLFDQVYNPDVLSCLANLSSDEVFTPPDVANNMLDMLPQDLFRNPDTTFLDPACKSGIFLREIAKRLLRGLESQIPDLQERIDHIMHKQLFGISITELTSLLSRRSVYCSKYPNSAYSVSAFDSAQGNIRYKRIEHTWSGEKCIFCGAAKSEYDNPSDMETHAYELLHIQKPEEIFGMKFDVIISNPPYQLSDGGAQKSASPLYHEFILQAKKLDPKYITMIVPARWYNGGKGLDEFREEMLSDQQLSIIHDFPDTSDCFPGVNVRGGICYFLWEKGHVGDCVVVNHNGKNTDTIKRPLLEKGASTFIRYNKAVEILRKVQAFKEPTMDELVSSRKPFGFATNFIDYSLKKTAEKNIYLSRFGTDGYVSRRQIERNREWVDCWKIFEPYASPGTDDYPHLVLSKPIVSGPGTACTETYLVIGPFDCQKTAENVALYMKSKLFRFLLILLRSAQHITQKVYAYVPQQDFSKEWTDKELYDKYGITEDEARFIDTLVKDVDWD